MDILKTFSLLGDGSDVYQINIKGTPEDPLFQANQIGKILGIANISTALKDFGVEERYLISKEGPLFLNEGSKNSNESLVQTNFLTELGFLYRLLSRFELEEKRSENIRLQGEYDIEQQELTIKQKELTIRQRELELEIKRIDCKQHGNYENENTVDVEISDKEIEEEEEEEEVEEEINEEVIEEVEIKTETGFTVKQRMNGVKVPFVYQYNPTDLKTWIKKWDSPADVERNITDISPAPLRASAKNNTIYKDYRWVFLSRNAEPPAEIEATINKRHKSPEVHLIAMIDIKKTKILAVYKNQKEAVEARNLKCNSFTRAIKEESVSSGHYWNYFDKCSNAMKEEFLSHSKLPEKYVPNSGKQVQQVDPKTNRVLQTYKSNREICKLFQMSVTKLKEVIKNNEIHKGFKWVTI